jgi:hypothetical protein
VKERKKRAVRNVLEEEFAARQCFLRQVRNTLVDKLGDDDWARVPLKDLESWISDKESKDSEAVADEVITQGVEPHHILRED